MREKVHRMKRKEYLPLETSMKSLLASSMKVKSFTKITSQWSNINTRAWSSTSSGLRGKATYLALSAEEMGPRPRDSSYFGNCPKESRVSQSLSFKNRASWMRQYMRREKYHLSMISLGTMDQVCFILETLYCVRPQKIAIKPKKLRSDSIF